MLHNDIMSPETENEWGNFSDINFREDKCFVVALGHQTKSDQAKTSSQKNAKHSLRSGLTSMGFL